MVSLGNRGDYSYDRADRITSAGSTTYTVDANGNLTARGSDTFTYDQASRLKSTSVSGTGSTYAYDGDGKRTSKTVGGTQTGYLYDVNASLPVLLDDGTHKYVWGLGLAFAVDTSGNPIVYHTDGLGSVRALTDGSGNVVQTYQYDEYGNVVSSSGSITQSFQYVGEQRDETGLVYLRARMYDPVGGRFLGRDPVPGRMTSPSSLNRYVYAESNPIDLVDPSGLDTGGGCITEDFGVGVYHTRTICVVVATNTDVGVTWSSGIGGTSGIKVGIGAGGQVSAGNSISDLEGDAIVIGGSVRAGPGASVEYFQNTRASGYVSGVNISRDIGLSWTPEWLAPLEVHTAYTRTSSLHVNVRDLWEQLRKLIQGIAPSGEPAGQPKK